MSDIPSSLDTAKFRHLVLEKAESIAGLSLPAYTQVLFSSYNNIATPPQPELITLVNNGTTVATIALTFDGSNNIASITRTS